MHLLYIISISIPRGKEYLIFQCCKYILLSIYHLLHLGKILDLSIPSCDYHLSSHHISFNIFLYIYLSISTSSHSIKFGVSYLSVLHSLVNLHIFFDEGWSIFWLPMVETFCHYNFIENLMKSRAIYLLIDNPIENEPNLYQEATSRHN